MEPPLSSWYITLFLFAYYNLLIIPKIGREAGYDAFIADRRNTLFAFRGNSNETRDRRSKLLGLLPGDPEYICWTRGKFAMYTSIRRCVETVIPASVATVTGWPLDLDILRSEF